jgi:hypothetical protein
MHSITLSAGTGQRRIALNMARRSPQVRRAESGHRPQRAKVRVCAGSRALASNCDANFAMANVAYFERALAQPNTLQPDRLAQSGRKPPFKPVIQTCLTTSQISRPKAAIARSD